MDKLLAALKRSRHGHRDWLIGLVIYRHGLRVSEACDLRWDDIDLPKRTMIVRRLKGSTDSVHYLERDEVNGLKLLQRQQQAGGIKGAYVFINERSQPFARMGIGRMIERAGEAAGLPFPVHVRICALAASINLLRLATFLVGYMIFQQLFNVGAERLASFSSLGRSARDASPKKKRPRAGLRRVSLSFTQLLDGYSATRPDEAHP